jgi:hypothetical protein
LSTAAGAYVRFGLAFPDMTVLDLDPSAYGAAAHTVADRIGGALGMTVERLGARLAGTYGMAGSDDVGGQWGAAYDVAAQTAVSALTDTVNAALCLGALLEQTGINYAGAEAACVPGESAAQTARRLRGAAAHSAPDLPSSVGAGIPEPGGWSLLQHAIGRVWPNGHQDLLHEAAAAWQSAAADVRLTLPDLDSAIGAVLLQRAPEVNDAGAVLGGLRARLGSLAGHFGSLGASCSAYAHHLDQAHSAIVHECVEFVDITIAAEMAGGLFAVVTAGLSEAAANGAVAAAAVRIGRTIADLIDAFAAGVVAIAAELDATAAEFVTIQRELAPVLARRAEAAEIVRPGVIGQVGPVTGTTPTDIALGRLASYAAKPRHVLPDVDNPKLFDPACLRGMDLDEVRRRIPAHWRRLLSKDGDGEVFQDPAHLGRQIRLMPGYPPEVRPGVINHGPYAVVAQNSEKIKVALAGNPTLK